ncbi:uncharacterized protein [Watersipora subatra]|uniref:uncharacterized protein n=1 Tax=Watersipora subatra TaxID=2589382 RepID=UPI00355C4A78
MTMVQVGANMVLLSNLVIILTASFCVLVSTTAAYQNETSSVDAVNHTVFETSGYKSCNESEEYDACLSGGRMYQLLSSLKPGYAGNLGDCISECMDSYRDQIAEHACEDGCRAEESVVSDRQRKLADYTRESDSLIQRALNQQVLSHWMFTMITGFDLFNDWYDPSNDDEGSTTYLFVEQSDNALRISSYRVINGPLYFTTSDATEDDSVTLNPYLDSDDAEPCYMQGTYSKLALCLLLFSSAFFLIWLTCSTVSTAPRKSVSDRSEKLRDKKALSNLIDTSPAPVHYPSYSDEDEKMLIA